MQKILVIVSSFMIASDPAFGCIFRLKNLFFKNARRDPVIATSDWGNTRFEFSASGKNDRILHQDSKSKPLVLYDGTLRRIPVTKSRSKEAVRVPRAVAGRASAYPWLDGKYEQSDSLALPISVKGGTLILHWVRGDYPEGGYRLGFNPISTFFIPHEYPSVTDASVRFLDTSVPAVNGRPRQSAQYLVIAIREGRGDETLKDFIGQIRKFQDLVRVEDPNAEWSDEPSEYYDYVRNPIRSHTWLVRLARPISWPVGTPPHDSEQLLESRGIAKKIGDADYSAFSMWWIEGETLYLKPFWAPELIELSNPSWRETIEVNLRSP